MGDARSGAGFLHRAREREAGSVDGKPGFTCMVPKFVSAVDKRASFMYHMLASNA